MADPRALLPAGLHPFSGAERQMLVDYHDVMGDFDALALTEPREVRITIADGDDRVEGVGSVDELLALAATVRKVAELQNEPATFDKVRALLERHAHQAGGEAGEQMKTWLKQLKALRANARTTSSMLDYHVETADGSSTAISPQEMIDMLLNGAGMHSDRDKRARFKQLGGLDSVPMRSTITTTLWDIVRLLRALDLLVVAVLEQPALFNEQE